jgi:hypothetical protein
MESVNHAAQREPRNKGKLVGQKPPLKLKEIWAIRIRPQMQGRNRELALFEVGIDSKLRACDLVKLKVRDVCHGDHVSARRLRVGSVPSDSKRNKVTRSRRKQSTVGSQNGGAPATSRTT